jgi:ankyrin repeat protein
MGLNVELIKQVFLELLFMNWNLIVFSLFIIGSNCWDAEGMPTTVGSRKVGDGDRKATQGGGKRVKRGDGFYNGSSISPGAETKKKFQQGGQEIPESSGAALSPNQPFPKTPKKWQIVSLQFQQTISEQLSKRSELGKFNVVDERRVNQGDVNSNSITRPTSPPTQSVIQSSQQDSQIEGISESSQEDRRDKEETGKKSSILASDLRRKFIEQVREIGQDYEKNLNSSKYFVEDIEKLIRKFKHEDDAHKLVISLLFCAIDYGCERLITCIITFIENHKSEFIGKFSKEISKENSNEISNEILIAAARSEKELSIEIYKKFFESPFFADANADDSEALVSAAENGYKELCNFLTTCGCSPAQASARRSRALRLAAENGHYEVCELLLDCKENAAKANDVNSQALILVAGSTSIKDQARQTELCKRLLGADSDPAQANALDGEALIRAVETGSLETCKLLLSFTVNNFVTANIQDSLALVKAAGHGHLEICKWLVEPGEIEVENDSEAFKKARIEGAALIEKNGYAAFIEAAKATAQEICEYFYSYEHEKRNNPIPKKVLENARKSVEELDKNHYGYTGILDYLNDLIYSRSSEGSDVLDVSDTLVTSN